MISENIKSILESPTAGVIRKMFEEGAVLKAKFALTTYMILAWGILILILRKKFLKQ